MMSFLLFVGSAIAQRSKENNNPVTGTWKYTNQSTKNDFQKVLNASPMLTYKDEYFVFEANNKFRHEFIDENGKLVKTLNGKWKTIGDKIRIDYADVDYSLTLDYYFLDRDLVMGYYFNHVIFTRDNFDSQNIALK